MQVCGVAGRVGGGGGRVEGGGEGDMRVFELVSVHRLHTIPTNLAK